MGTKALIQYTCDLCGANSLHKNKSNEWAIVMVGCDQEGHADTKKAICQKCSLKIAQAIGYATDKAPPK